MLSVYHTPDHVVRHCEAVTNTALIIAGALIKKGYDFDVQLIEAAGLLHDIARVEERHWVSGADFARKKGFRKEAAIIKNHMTHTFDTDPAKLKEIDMVCLADRVILEDAYVGVDARMEYLVKKINADSETTAFIMSRKEITKTLVKNIESVLGMSFDALMQKRADSGTDEF
jgi:putative nucleotidyltransferase with HDIG domain